MRPVPPRRATWLALFLSLVAGLPAARSQPCPDPPIYPPTRAFVQPTRPCPGQDVRILFATCAPCWDIVDVQQSDVGITVWTEQHRESCVPTICLPESASVPLGSFAAGHHAIVVRFVTTYVTGVSPDTVRCTFTNLDTLEFDVAPTCAQDTLPYVKEIVIGSPTPCLDCPPRICAGDSIPVLIRGEFPDNCISLLGVELVPSPIMAPFPVPPILRIVYGTNDCREQPCLAQTVPWQTKVLLPPLPASSGRIYWLRVEAALKRFHCMPPPDSSVIGVANFPFAVSERCSTSVASCLLSSFETTHNSLEPCDAFVQPGQPAYATFRIGSGVALYGLEGQFLLTDRQLVVTGIETVGAAVGMRLAWQPTDQGARFVLYSEGGASIPAVPPLPYSGHQPILRVRVELRPTDVLPPPRIFLRADGLLGADAKGDGIFSCIVNMRDAPVGAYVSFCTGGPCDFNRDGATDVRDLVGMVNCLNGTAACEATRGDCDADGGFDLDDVMCCAHVLLGAGPADTTGGRPDPSLRVRFGAPETNEGTIEIPVTLEGANPVGAARLVLRYPADRFTAAVEFPGRSSWLELQQVAGGRVVVGLLDMGGASSRASSRASSGASNGASAGAFQHSFTLRLTLRDGRQAGGEVMVDAAEFSDPAGAALIADLGPTSVLLGDEQIALGAARPNPFARDVEFTVTLARGGELEVAVHDLAGRRIAVLHQGPAAAGGHRFRWDGSDDHGSAAPGGIYFYRARLAGTTLSRKVILIRER